MGRKRLFICCDGTWNEPQQREFGLLAPTNVLKFANAVARGPVTDDTEQRVYYHPGVGTARICGCGSAAALSAAA